MFSRDDHQFVLAPWEHRGATFDARPDFVTSLEIGGRERVWMLKVKQNALWFREAGRDANWTFGLFAPLEKSSEAAQIWARDAFILKWFESELRAGNFGRVVVWDEFWTYLGRFVFLFGADGRGLAREPWDDFGLDFRWDAAPQFRLGEFLDWPHADFEKLADGLDHNRALIKKFGDREVPTEQQQGEELHWICGSREELEMLTRALAFWAWNWENDNVTFFYSSESEHGSARCVSAVNRRATGSLGSYREHMAPAILKLATLFLDYHTPVGFQWEFQDMGGGRGSWDAEPTEIDFTIQAPSAHEKLEAGLFLRAWLHGKVAESEIDGLLSAPL